MATAQARVNAARAEIRQVVSYVTLHNVSYDSGTGVVSSNEMKLYNSDAGSFPAAAQVQPQPAPTLAGSASTGDAGLNWTTIAPVSSAQWNTEFALMWLAVFLAIPLLIGLLCFCLCMNRKEDSINKSLISRDAESGGSDDSKTKEEK